MFVAHGGTVNYALLSALLSCACGWSCSHTWTPRLTGEVSNSEQAASCHDHTHRPHLVLRPPDQHTLAPFPPQMKRAVAYSEGVGLIAGLAHLPPVERPFAWLGSGPLRPSDAAGGLLERLQRSGGGGEDAGRAAMQLQILKVGPAASTLDPDSGRALLQCGRSWAAPHHDVNLISEGPGRTGGAAPSLAYEAGHLRASAAPDSR